MKEMSLEFISINVTLLIERFNLIKRIITPSYVTICLYLFHSNILILRYGKISVIRIMFQKVNHIIL
jgi:hypothetical protein